MSPRWGEESSGRPQKAINMSLLRSEDVPRRSRIVVKKTKKLLTCYIEVAERKTNLPFHQLYGPEITALK
jgi:hypothetical protein